MEWLHSILNTVVDWAILLFESMGVVVIVVSGIQGIVEYVTGNPLTRLNLAKGMATGLEFKLGSEILRTVDIFRCKVIDVSPTEMTIEATGDHEKLRAIISLLHRFGIKEIARTGSVVMRRSNKSE